MIGEQDDQFILSGCQIQFSLVQLDGMFHYVDAEIAANDRGWYRLLNCLCLLSCRLPLDGTPGCLFFVLCCLLSRLLLSTAIEIDTPQHGAYTGCEFTYTKGFADVVVGSNLQS